ncbi:uncharacterized protein PV07_05480 [Cladophialophora immunda]|uniref:Zn(2)-C6 fungal-type domain-containing protein n=1 Tax=Cladophialophora immunda TaxID=569365 RepID=A0A0D2CHM4_9EURO|nr:uncharacterized protein PV07_05480 [Cladophialophora immunda]KIW29685.1 hypothetical protein PV07_05480 [Cladophialophora immunda]
MLAETSATIQNGLEEGNTTPPLRQMRKGTKSCQECRRRKIKCNYPPTPPSSPAQVTDVASAAEERKCIQCKKHNRNCQIQGYVALGTSREPTDVATPMKPSSRQPRIYKRRREMQSSTSHPNDEEYPRVKIHVDRMESVVARLAQERQKEREHDGVPTSASEQTQRNTFNFPGSSAELVSASNLFDGHDFNPGLDLDAELGFNNGSVFANALNFDLDFGGGNPNSHFTYDERGNASTRIQPQVLLEQEMGNGIRASTTINSHPFLPTQQQPQESISTNGTGGACITSAMTSEEHCRTLSPLLSQLFNNEMFTQSTACVSSVLAERIEFMNFSDTSNNSAATDAEKLLSTISSEPYVLKVLDISVKWWIAWRDQAAALQEVSPFLRDDERQTQAQGMPSMETGVNASSFSSTRPGPVAESRPTTHSGDPPSFREFVLTKLSRSQEPVSLATGLLCVALSLYQLRPGIDDRKLNISTSPSELADRIVLAVDTIVLCPTSPHKHTADPGMLLLLMIRAKMYAESNQLRKSWLCIRRALEYAKDTGFAEPKMPIDVAQYAPELCGRELTKLFHRQRFLGSIMELDRLMSMVLGFPHAEDVKFTDHLAMAVLRGQTASQGGGSVSVDIKMRAFRRVVSIAAGRVNDRNASSDSDRVKLQTTMDIQATLNEVAAAMPPGWWDVESHLETPDPFLAHEHLIAQMWFWQVQTFLHLPFMLKVNNPNLGAHSPDCDNIHNGNVGDPYEVNKYLCLQGCRGMLRAFNLLRSDPSLAVYICSCEDFQGLFSACILMVGLLMRLSYCSQSPPELEPNGVGNVGEDLALIEEIKDVFRYRATQQGGGISRQGLRVLKELGSFLYEDVNCVHRADVKRRTVVLPYFGAIHLELRPPSHLHHGFNGRANVPQSNGVPTPGLGAELHMASQSASEPASDEGIGTDYPDPLEPMCLPSSTWDLEANIAADAGAGVSAGGDFGTDEAFQFSMPESSLNWDRFLYGSELAQNWSAELPEWPASMDMLP